MFAALLAAALAAPRGACRAALTMQICPVQIELEGRAMFRISCFKRAAPILVFALATTGLSALPAAAGMLTTDQILIQNGHDPGIRTMLEAELQRHGLDMEEAAARVDAIGDAELAALSENYGRLPAGQEVIGTPKQAMVVFLIILIVVLLV